MCVCRAVKSGYIATFLFFKDENNFKRHSYNSNPPPPTVHMNSDLLWTEKKIGHWNVNAGFLFFFFFLLIIIIYWYSVQVSSQEPLGKTKRCAQS